MGEQEEGRRGRREGRVQGDGGGGRGQGDGGGEGGTEGGRERGRDGEREGERARGGREEAIMLRRQRAPGEEGRVEGGRVDEGNERGRGSKGGKLQGKYPEEGTSQYTVYSKTIPQHGPCH